MEKTINLGDKQVKLRSTAATPIFYKNQFKHDFFGDMLKLATGLDGLKTNDDGEVDVDNLDPKVVENFDISTLYNFIWALAKGADKKIGEPLDFFEQYESLDISELFPQIQDLLFSSIQTTKKSTAPTNQKS